MQQKFLVLTFLAVLFSACHIASEEPIVDQDDIAYEAYGLLTIPSSAFTKDNVRTKIVFTNDELLDIYMFDVKFAALMPVTIDMVINGVGYTQSGNEIHFYGDSIIPKAGNKPYNKYIITDLEGQITSDSLFINNKYGATPSVYKGKLAK